MVFSLHPWQAILFPAVLLASFAVRAQSGETGSLIRLRMHSTVAVLLDEIPPGPLCEEAAANALQKAKDFWLQRARSQVGLMKYRLVFRSNPGEATLSPQDKPRGPLPLPPESVWNVALGRAQRQNLQGHDLVGVDYEFDSTIVSDAASPATVEPRLAEIGGHATESFHLPADPQLLFERTGYACMNEHEYPPGSVFEENARFFYDDTCTAKSQKCHITAKPDLSCEDALLRDVGRVRTELNFTRVAYNAHIAAPYRVGTIRPDANDTADLAVIPAGLSDTRAFLYRFFAPGSCELEEGVIGRFGWRRLLTFSAIVRNDGGRGIDLGDVSDPDNPYVASHAFEYSACHQHYHFSHYGTFTYHDAVGTKRAFCLEETDRYHNNEKTPLTAKHQTCANQGIGAGWGDEYHFGIPGQWVDVTDIDTTTPHELGFLANPDQFLCEGLLEHDDQGQPLFEPTPFANTAGQIQTRARCRFLKDWNRNNFESLPVASQGGCFVTEDCRRGQLGPKRNCGFSEHPDYKMRSCTSGASVKLTCNAGSGKAALLRVCEVSKQLGVGVACTLADAKANVMVETTPTEVTFACPEVRDALMVDDDSGTLIPTAVPGTGGYSIYLAPMGTLSDQEMEKPTVLCTAG